MYIYLVKQTSGLYKLFSQGTLQFIEEYYRFEETQSNPEALLGAIIEYGYKNNAVTLKNESALPNTGTYISFVLFNATNDFLMTAVASSVADAKDILLQTITDYGATITSLIHVPTVVPFQPLPGIDPAVLDAKQDKELSTPLSIKGSDYDTVESSLEALATEINNGGGGTGISATLQSALTTSMSVGGITSGSVYSAGTPLETILRNLLDPIQYPILTNPSVVLTSSPSSTLIETNATASVTLTANFNRGSISPAYGTSGYRSGAAIDYSLNGDTAQSNSSWDNVIVDDSHTSFSVVTNYAAGEQPKDSKGNNYNSPLAAGSVTSNTLTYEFVNALWANTASISNIAKLNLVSFANGTSGKVFDFPDATIASPEVFDVPASWTVTSVEVYDTFNQVWIDCSSEFTITETTHPDGGNVDTNYNRYTCNRGIDMGSRQIRIKWN